MAGLGWHGLRRKFATELKEVPIKDLCALEGWKTHRTVVECYQQPDEQTMRQALEDRRELRERPEPSSTDSTNRQYRPAADGG